MKLLLALSVVLIALTVLAEPSSAESQENPSIKDRFKDIGEAIKGAAVKMGEKAKSVFKELHDSDFGTKTRNAFTQGIQKIKDKFSK